MLFLAVEGEKTERKAGAVSEGEDSDSAITPNTCDELLSVSWLRTTGRLFICIQGVAWDQMAKERKANEAMTEGLRNKTHPSRRAAPRDGEARALRSGGEKRRGGKQRQQR
jgi:hypothetical protein